MSGNSRTETLSRSAAADADRSSTGAASASQSHRLRTGGLIDRRLPMNFTFDGKQMSGFAGDTLASALIANGVNLVARSFKYHRPRGILTAGAEEPNALVEMRLGARREANTRATTAELYDGLIANSQNRWPSLRHDVMAVNSLASPIFVAGFYYKTFMWPAKFWEKIYEPMIRRAAGLGRSAQLPDPDQYDKAWAHCDVLIAGSGAAGLSAALSAGRTGARVILCEEDSRLGGRLLSEQGEIDGIPAIEWVKRVSDELAGMSNVTIMPRTAVFGVFDGGTYGAIERVSDHVPVPAPHHVRQRMWRIVAKRSVIAAGAIERPIVFPNNDRPGVMMASAVRTYINRFAAMPGKRVAVFTNNDDGWRSVDAIRNAGGEVAAVIDPRGQAHDGFRSLGNSADLRVIAGQVTDVNANVDGVRAISVTSADGRTQSIPADLVAMSGGWNPNVALSSYHRGRPVWDDRLAAFVPGECPTGLEMVGAANGDLGLASCLAKGHEAGIRAAADAGFSGSTGNASSASDESYSIKPLWHVDAKGKAFVDFQHDVTASDVELAQREGFESVEHLKRYTTLGMATDQGKLSNINGLAIMAKATGRAIPETGTTIYRPPYAPVAIGAFAGGSRGKDFKATRLTPSHYWAIENGAEFVDVGQWKRAQWYKRPGETDWMQTVKREVLTVRNGVGFCDVTTLGKVDVRGPDAGVFLDRLYINPFAKLAVGRARYGLMLREDGIAMDDGTTSRLAEDHYFLTTTTAKAGPVMQHLEFSRQVLWPELDVQLSSASDQWAQYSIAGPKARDLLQNLCDPSEDMTNDGFPFMGVREVKLRGGMTARLFRISFSGEIAFEIAVPARYGEALARNMMIAGAPFGCIPYGTEALGVMRIEKGHVAGPELSGMTTADDLGLGGMASKKKEFIGRVMAGRDGMTSPDRQVVVGIKPVSPTQRLRSGAHVLPKGAIPGPETDQGYVTSVCFSPMMNQWVGMGLVSKGRDRHGEIVRIYDPVRNEDFEAELCSPIFYDPEGGRQRG